MLNLIILDWMVSWPSHIHLLLLLFFSSLHQGQSKSHITNKFLSVCRQQGPEMSATLTNHVQSQSLLNI
jgi:hypothetical protein